MQPQSVQTESIQSRTVGTSYHTREHSRVKHTQTEKFSKNVGTVTVSPTTVSIGTDPIWPSDQKQMENICSTPMKGAALQNTSPIKSINTSINLGNCSARSDSTYLPEYSTLHDSDMSHIDQSCNLEKNYNPVKDRKFIIFESELNKLLNACPVCREPICEQTKRVQGTALFIKFECLSGHVYQWCSQPFVSNMCAGNLLLAAACVFTGETFETISQLAEALNLSMFSKNTYYDVQKQYLVPVVNTHWINQQQLMLGGLGTKLNLVGDGQCDSPGFNAKYCIYTLMEEASRAIVSVELTSVHQASSSQGMEKVGLIKSLDKLYEMGIDISRLGTDRHIAITALIRDEYPEIEHEFDVYHMAKWVQIKLFTKAQKKECIELKPWIQSVVCHLWYSSRNCLGNADIIVELWKSIIHHIVDVHSWNIGEHVTSCDHAPLLDDERRKKKWLTEGSAAHEALKEVVLNAKFLRDIRKLTKFCHTSGIENYHSVALKYRPKRLAFAYESMQMRSQLAALDHNYNLGRKQATTQDGKLRYSTVFTKRRKAWIVKKIYEKKDRNWVQALMLETVEARMGTGRDLEYVPNPGLAKNIATIPRPNKKDLIEEHISRY